MRIRIVLTLFVLLAAFQPPAHAQDGSAILLASPPQWNVGDTWQYRIEKKMDRTVTQGEGLLEISMRLDKVVSDMTYTVQGIIDADGEQCYLLRASGTQTITGTYSATQLEGEAMSGSLIQSADIKGVECRRTSDLAFVRSELRSTGNITIGGVLGGIPTPFESHSISIASPPAEVFRFPIIRDDKWRVSATLSTSTSGTSTDSIVTTYNYNCKVLGLQTITLDNGDSYECIVISQDGSQTVQSKTSGINIEDVSGKLFFAPAIGNRVRDEAEGEELVQYKMGEKEAGASDEETEPQKEPLTR